MKKIISWAATAVLALGIGFVAIPESEQPQTASAASQTTLFSDDFQSYTSYGDHNGGTGTMKSKWANQWFDGVGDGTYDSNCSSSHAAIAKDPANSSNTVLQLKTATTDASFFYVGPRDTSTGLPMVLTDYEVSFKFKINPTSKMTGYCATDTAPWLATLNRKTLLNQDGDYVPGDGRFNGTNSIMMASRSGIRNSDPSGTNPYFYAEVNRCLGSTTSAANEIKNEDRTDYASDITNLTMYNTWHEYKCIVNGDSFDMYLNGVHLGGYDVANDMFRQPGYLSIACCVWDGYIDDFVVKTVAGVEYTISATSEDTSKGTVTGGGTYAAGTDVTLTATPKAGYSFAGWYEGDTCISTEASYNLKAAANRTLVAKWGTETYTVTTTKNIDAAGSVTGGGTFTSGQTTTLVAQSNPGYTFDGWYLDGTKKSSNASYQITVTGSATYEARWTLSSCTISATASPTTGGTIEGAGSYNYGAEVTLKATTNAGYTFDGWYNGSSLASSSETYTFEAKGDMNLTAKWTEITYKITTTRTPIKGGSVSGAGEYAQGEKVTIKATANSGYTFEGWYLNGSKVSSSASYEITVTADATYQAKFVTSSSAVTTHTITASSEDTAKGTVTGGGEVAEGESVTLVATANTGYTFEGWYEGSSKVSSNATYTFSVSAAKTLVAKFVKNTYTITVAKNSDVAGTVTGGGSYEHGASVTLTAQSNAGFTFLGWFDGNTQLTNNATYTFTANATKTYTAKWKMDTYTVSVSTNPTNGGRVSGAGDFSSGTTATLTATCATGYSFDGWYVGGSKVETNVTYSFTVSADTAVTAKFVKNTYTITTVKNSETAGTVTGSGSYEHGASVTLTAQSNAGFTFLGWFDGERNLTTNATYTFTATASKTFTAKWEVQGYTIVAYNENEDAGSVTGGAEYAYGADVTLTAVPNAGYTFAGWYNGNVLLTSNLTYQTTATANATYTAKWTRNEYVITVGKNIADAGTVDGAGTYYYGDTVALQVYTNAGYIFDGWYVGEDKVSADLVYTFTAEETLSLQAKWTIEGQELIEYRVTLGKNIAEAGTVAGAGTYVADSEITLTATTNAGYTFLGWFAGETELSTDAEYVFYLGANMDITAKWSLNSYAIIVAKNVAEAGTVEGANVYEHGATVTLTAADNAGYTFLGWFDGATQLSAQATYTFTATEDKALTAKWTKNSYDISVAKNIAVAGTVEGADVYEHGAEVTLTATTAIGYTFNGWFDGSEELSTEVEYTFTVEANKTITAKWTLNTYTVEVEKNIEEAGSVTGANTYEYGASVTLTASTEDAYTFLGWFAGETKLFGGNSYNFVATSDVTITAKWEEKSYVITVENNEEAGTVTGANTYAHGAEVTLTATANDTYVFLGWFDGDVQLSQEAEYKFTATANRTIKAEWKHNVFTVVVNKNIAAAGTVTGDGTYESGVEVTLTATTNAGYTFDGWYVNGVRQSAELTYKFPVTANTVVSVDWTKELYTITIENDDEDAGTVSESNDYYHGDPVLLEATANVGYTFLGWFEGDEKLSANAEYVFTAEGSKDIVAKWEASKYTISVASDNEDAGEVEVEGESNVFNHGTTVKVIATVNEGYTFDGWYVGATKVSSDATYSFTADANKSLVAKWTVTTFDITVTNDNAEAGTVAGAGEYVSGADVTLTATPVFGYTFLGWFDGETNLSAEKTYTFTAEADKTIVAKWTVTTLEVSATAELSEVGTINLIANATIISIKKDGEDVAAAKYTYTKAEGKLVFSAEYVAELGVGTWTFVIDTDSLDVTATLVVTGGGTAEKTVKMGKSASVTLKKDAEIISVKKNGSVAVTETTQYTYVESTGKIKFLASYLQTLGTGNHSFVIETNKGIFNVTITVEPNADVEGGNGGCGSVVGVSSATAILGLAGAALVARKRRKNK